MSNSSICLCVFLSFCVLTAAETPEVGKCCAERGAVSGHFIGVAIILVLGVSLNQGVFRALFPKAYFPGSSAFCRRMLMMEFIEIGFVAMAWRVRENLETEIDASYIVFFAVEIAVFIFVMFSWSTPFRRYSLFFGSTKDRARMAELNKQIRSCRSTITGRKLVGDALKKEVKLFNRTMNIKYAMARAMSRQIIALKITNMAFVWFQYFKFCSLVNCSFFRQLATCLTIASMAICLVDFIVLSKNRAFNIKLDDGPSEEGGKKTNMQNSSVSQLEAYAMIRDLIAEIMECGRFAVFELTGVAEFRSMSVVTYDWQQNPEVDPRIDACVWMVSYAIALANEVNTGNALSVTGLHMAGNTMRKLRQQISSNTPSRVEIMKHMSILYQTAFFALPDVTRLTVMDAIRTWADSTKNSPDPRFDALNCLVNMLPESNHGVRTINENVEILKIFFDVEFKELLTGEDIHIHDDAYLEWVYVAWGAMKKQLRDVPRVQEVQHLLQHVIETQDPKLLIGVADLIHKLRGDLQNTFANQGESVNTFVEGLQKLTEGRERKVSTVGGPPSIASKDLKKGNTEIPSAADLKIVFTEMISNGVGLSRKEFAEFLKTQKINLPPLQKNKLLADDIVEWSEFETEIPFLVNTQTKRMAGPSVTSAAPVSSSGPQAKKSIQMSVLSSAALGDNKAVIDSCLGFGPDGAWSRAEYINYLNERYIEALVPCMTIERIPDDLVRVKPAKDVAAGVDLLAPLGVVQLSKLLDNDLDIRQFLQESSSVIGLITSPLAKTEAGRVDVKKPKAATVADKTETKRVESQIKTRLKRLNRWLPTPRHLWHWFLDYTLYFLWSCFYIIVFIRCVATINKRGDPSKTNDITFFGLPPHYVFEKDVQQRILIPIVYGIMHGNLITFGLLPLSMSRWLIRLLSKNVYLGRFFKVEHMYHLHMRLGYNLFWGILISAIIWWIAVHHACTEHFRSCVAFNPVGTYIDIYNNKGAVLFLREMVVSVFAAMLFTISLIFPKGALGLKTPFWKPNKAYEMFYYTHILGFSAVVILAFTSRFDVFYPTLIGWGWYAIDITIMRVFNTHRTEVAGATTFGGSNPAVNLKIKKPEGFHYNAGQTAFIKIPYLSVLEWHPFSVASSPHDEFLEFIIDCSHGKDTWTGKLHHVCSTAGKGSEPGTFELQVYRSEETEPGRLDVEVFGPNGSSFQSFEKFPNILLIGGGSGLPSSLSVLRHLFHVKKNDKSCKCKKVLFVWSTRQFESLLWCWGHLKNYIEQECGLMKHMKWSQRHDESLQTLTGWLDLTIHVTQMKQEAFNLLVDIERNSVVGSWLVHRLSAGRINKWTSVFSRFNEDQDSGKIKAFFCGPSVMATAIREAAKTMTGFHIDVSSENFHDN